MDLPDVEELIVLTSNSLRDCMLCLDNTAQGICFVVDNKKVLKGILTDGDVRRSILKGFSLDSKAGEVMQTNFVALPVSSKTSEIQERLSLKIRHIPLLDEKGRIIDYACFHRLHKIPVMSPIFNGNELKYVTECVETSWISSQGNFIARFEEMFKEYLGVPYALAASNGTTALHLAMLALGIGPGDEVIVPDLTFAATINSVIYVGATPVIVDIDEKTLTISPESVARAITSKTKAVLPVHLYGHPCDMDPLIDLAGKHGLLIIEDCAESLGSKYKGKLTGNLADAAAFSFFGNKTITTGEGGMVVFKDRLAYEKAAIFRDHGMSKAKRYWHDFVGYNYRMTNLQAAIGVAQMERIEDTLKAKRDLAKRYNSLLESLNIVILPPEEPWACNSYWLYTVLLKPGIEGYREVLMKHMLLNGIDTRPVFYPLHQMPVYSGYCAPDVGHVSADVSVRGLSLPSSKELSLEQQSLICRVLSDAVCQQNFIEKLGNTH